MNHLRKMLQDVNGIELVFRNGYFCLVFGEEFYCDYVRLIALTPPERKKKEDPGAIRTEWLEILLWGKFISTAKSNLFDYYKQKVESLIHSLLPKQLELAYENARFSIVIRLYNIPFIANPLLDIAFVYTVCTLWKQNDPEKAIRRYVVFTKDYKRMMNRGYNITFADIEV